MRLKVCVVGAGPIGLSTAFNLVDKLPELDITLIAEKFSPHTTGDVAAGIILPHALRDTPIDKIRQWVTATKEHAKSLTFSPVASEAGAQYLTLVAFNQAEQNDPEWKDMLDNYRHLSSKELVYHGFVGGYACETYMIECRRYLPWLLKRFQEKGGKVESRKIERLDQLYDKYDIVVNCTGVGAHHLAGDKSVQPLRGQAIRVKAPWIKHFYDIGDGDTYIIPGADYVVLGGTHQAGNWDTQVSEKDAAKIWKGCTELIPSLKKAEIISHHVGLRPSRPRVRLESQLLRHGSKPVLVVHNYGHGGAGVTLHWGCALEATELVQTGKNQLQNHAAKL